MTCLMKGLGVEREKGNASVPLVYSRGIFSSKTFFPRKRKEEWGLWSHRGPEIWVCFWPVRITGEITLGRRGSVSAPINPRSGFPTY